MRKVSILIGICSMSMAASAQSLPSGGANDVTTSVAPYKIGPAPPLAKSPGGIHWAPLFRQWWLNLAFEHTERILQERKTRDELSGPFFHDWIDSVSSYRFDRWDDNDKFFTSNLGHPAQGAIVAAIFWQNDDHVRFSDQDFHSAAYRKALLQAFAFVTFDAVQYKLGPMSEASIGNVGSPSDRCQTLHIPCSPRTGLNDLLLNETGGMAMTIGFQWLDKHVQKRFERREHSHALINTTRIFTNPPQSMANIFRFKAPWFRDNR
jgi:hypothetical protein